MVFSVSVRNKYRAAYLVDLVDLSSIKNIIFLVILSCLTCLEEIVIFNFFSEKDSVLICIKFSSVLHYLRRSIAYLLTSH